MFIIAGSIHLGGVIYYLIFASGDKQPWADQEYETILPNVAAASSYNTLDDGFFPDNDGGERESLLTKSLRVDRMTAYDNDELETPSWFLNTI